MAIRTNTERMTNPQLQSSDTMANDLNIEEWFDPEKIIAAKKKWYDEQNIEIQNYALLQQITGDYRVFSDDKTTGLKLMINALFNNNKRLIIDFLGGILETPSNRDMIKRYDQLYKSNAKIHRFAARSIILGLIFKELDGGGREKSDKLFKQLKAYSSTGAIESGFARKILTLLHNAKKCDGEDEKDLAGIKEEILAGNTDRKYLVELCTILYYMNSYNRRDNDWIQLLALQTSEKTQSVQISTEEEMLRLVEERLDKLSLSILPAGEAFLEYVFPAYEYFAVRYCREYAPLFTLIPTPFELKETKDIKNTRLIKTIEGVKEHALHCCSEIMDDDIELFLNNDHESYMHADRIRKNHIEYLDRVAEFIEITYLRDEAVKNDKDILAKYTDLKKLVSEVRDQYRFEHKKA